MSTTVVTPPRRTSSASPTAVPHTNSRVFSTYPVPPSFFFSSSRNRSRVALSFSLSLSLYLCLSSSYPLAASLSPSSSFCRLTFRTCISTNPSSCVSRIRVTPVSPNANRNSVGRVKNEKIVAQGEISNVKLIRIDYGGSRKVSKYSMSLSASILGKVAVTMHNIRARRKLKLVDSG